ncbi:hypothetical protein GQ54DRAFT_299599, partial [Martensiomyces pterosporus]
VCADQQHLSIGQHAIVVWLLIWGHDQLASTGSSADIPKAITSTHHAASHYGPHPPGLQLAPHHPHAL